MSDICANFIARNSWTMHGLANFHLCTICKPTVALMYWRQRSRKQLLLVAKLPRCLILLNSLYSTGHSLTSCADSVVRHNAQIFP